MKTLYNIIAKRIAEIEEINWVDFNTGQLTSGMLRPAVDFPAVLIDLALPNCEKYGGGGTVENLQLCDVNITLTLAYWTEAHSFEGINEDMKNDALGVFDIINDIQDKLQEWNGYKDEFIFNAPLYRTAVNPVQSPTGLKVYNITYITNSLDDHNALPKYVERELELNVKKV